MEKPDFEKLKKWVNGLTPMDFYYITGTQISGGDTPEAQQRAKEISERTGLKLFDGELKKGDYFLVDSKYAEGNLCLVKQRSPKNKRGELRKKRHKVIKVLAPRSQFSNYAWGFFAVPDKKYLI